MKNWLQKTAETLENIASYMLGVFVLSVPMLAWGFALIIFEGISGVNMDWLLNPSIGFWVIMIVFIIVSQTIKTYLEDKGEWIDE